MIKIIAAARRRPGMTHGEYCEYVENIHGGLARTNPIGLSRYVQNHVFDGAYGRSGDAKYSSILNIDSVTELLFKDMRALSETLSSDYVTNVIAPDGVNFADLSTNITLTVTDTEEQVSRSETGGIKALFFIKAAEGVGRDELHRRWPEAHALALREHPAFAAALLRCVRSVPLHASSEENAMTSHFGDGDTVVYDGAVSYWLDGSTALPLFRIYQREIEAADSTDRLIDASRSFVVFAKEVPIFDLT